MAIRRRGTRWVVEVYDPCQISRKRYVGTFDFQSEAKDAEARERSALSRRRPARGQETVASFADRWLDLRPRDKESTNISYREQVKPFAEAYGCCPSETWTLSWPMPGFGRNGGRLPASAQCSPMRAA